MTLDNHRLSAQTAALLRDVDDARARIATAADDERRRIERDLHDGAQQRLVALAINLAMAAERAGDDGRRGRRSGLRDSGSDVEDALDELRSLTHGVSRVTHRWRPGRGACAR